MDYNLDPGAGHASLDGGIGSGLKDAERANEYTPVSSPSTGALKHEIISVSTALPPWTHTEAIDSGLLSPDLTIIAADGVHFYVHQTVLLLQSANRFGALLPRPAPSSTELPALPLPELSTVLQIVLHGLYGRPVEAYSPSVEDVFASLDALARYGISLPIFAAPGKVMWALIAYSVPLRPLDAYISAAKHNIYPMAALASGYLLDYPLLSITDDQVVQIGALYLKRLAKLLERRMDALRMLVLEAPPAHDITPHCNYLLQEALQRAWSHAIADLAYVASPGISTKDIRIVLEAHEADFDCPDCLRNFRLRSKTLLVQWSLVDRTI